MESPLDDKRHGFLLTLPLPSFFLKSIGETLSLHFFGRRLLSRQRSAQRTTANLGISRFLAPGRMMGEDGYAAVLIETRHIRQSGFESFWYIEKTSQIDTGQVY